MKLEEYNRFGSEWMQKKLCVEFDEIEMVEYVGNFED